MCPRGKEFPSVILAKQCTRTESDIDICLCKYDRRDVSNHENIINGGIPTKDSEPGYLRCPFILKGGHQCHATCQNTKPSGLVRHQEDVHLDIRRFKCTLCPETFKQAGHLNNHLNTQHTRANKFPCSYCEKKYTDPAALSRHEKAKHSEQPGVKRRKKRQPHGRRRHETNGSSTASTSQRTPGSPSSSELFPQQQQSLPEEISVIFQAQNSELMNFDGLGFEEELLAQSTALGFWGWDLSGEWFPAQVGESWAGRSGDVKGQDFQQDLVFPTQSVRDPAVGFAKSTELWWNAQQEVE